MNKKMFTGWKEVFSFSFEQNLKAKGFKSSFIIFVTVFFIIGLGINVLAGVVQDHNKNKKTFENKIEKLVIINDTEMKEDVILNYKEASLYADKMEIEISNEMVDFEAEENSNTAVLHVYFDGNYFEEEDKKDAFVVDVFYGNDALKKSAGKIGKEFAKYFNKEKYLLTDVSEEVAVYLSMDIQGNVIDIKDKEESLGVMLIKIFVPMIVVLILYFIILLYGQSIGKALVVEKDSKLMETLLISVKPYAVVLGKVLSLYLVAILQIFSFVIAFILGFVIGDVTAENIFKGYNNPVIMVIKLLENETKSAFSVSTIILGILGFLVGILLYFMLAALVASFATKTEELTNGMAIFQVIVVIGFFGAYLIPLMQQESPILKYLRIIPITSPYMVPSDVIIGNMGILEAIISIAIMLVVSFVLIIFTGKIYKKKVF